MTRFPTVVALSLATVSTSALAAPQLERVRGTVESMTATSVTVKTAEGKMQDVALAPDTHFVSVIKSSLDKIGDGKFIGTATKGENPPKALEVVIFPDSMKGTGEGHYAWDSINDTTKSGGITKSSMTNGTVKAGSSITKSSMTNGTVKSGMTAGGGKTITVTYDNGQSMKIDVPPSAPIVEFEPADKAILVKGVPFFSVTTKDGGKLTGKLVAIGKGGVVPPM